MKLYHVNKYFKQSFYGQIEEALKLDYKISYHFLDKMEARFTNEVLLHQAIMRVKKDLYNLTDRTHIFECECENDKVKKFVLRTKYDGKQDIVIVFLILENELMIKTAWQNDRRDNHRTLNYDKYESGE